MGRVVGRLARRRFLRATSRVGRRDQRASRGRADRGAHDARACLVAHSGLDLHKLRSPRLSCLGSRTAICVGRRHARRNLSRLNRGRRRTRNHRLHGTRRRAVLLSERIDPIHRHKGRRCDHPGSRDGHQRDRLTRTLARHAPLDLSVRKSTHPLLTKHVLGDALKIARLHVRHGRNKVILGVLAGRSRTLEKRDQTVRIDNRTLHGCRSSPKRLYELEVIIDPIGTKGIEILLGERLFHGRVDALVQVVIGVEVAVVLMDIKTVKAKIVDAEIFRIPVVLTPGLATPRCRSNRTLRSVALVHLLIGFDQFPGALRESTTRDLSACSLAQRLLAEEV